MCLPRAVSLSAGRQGAKAFRTCEWAARAEREADDEAATMTRRTADGDAAQTPRGGRSPPTSGPAPGLPRSLGAAARRRRRSTGRPPGAARRRDGGRAPHRIGQPSPLIFHLGAALLAYGQALLAAPRADSPSFPWGAELGVDRAALAELDQVEVAREIAARLHATVAGLEIWQRHPYRRALADPPAVWQDGCSRLLDYGAAPEAADPAGPPVLVVPSLINRPYILDLAPGRSHAALAGGAGVPAAPDGLGVARAGGGRVRPRRLRRASGCCRRWRGAPALAGRPVPVVGYCMGGTLAVGAGGARARTPWRRW